MRTIRVLVASPGDVTAERAHLRTVATELNPILQKTQQVTLEIVGWEQVYPDMGRAQAVINEQLANYDVFIGIMWKRFGSPTGAAESGTEEELRLAVEGYKQGRVKAVMFYFSQEAYVPTRADLAQVDKVLSFKEELNREALTYDYPSADAFPEILRSHLLTLVTSRLSPEGGSPIPNTPASNPVESAEDCSLSLAFGKKIQPINLIDETSRFRQSLVAALVDREGRSASAVVPIPHAGVFLATCWAELREERLWLAFGHSGTGSSMFRTPPDRSIRQRHAEQKLGTIRDPDLAKSVILIDEAVLSGLSLKVAVSTLRGAGVSQIFVRTLMPPVVQRCPFGVTHYVPGSGPDREWMSDPSNNECIAEELGADDYNSLRSADIHVLGLPRRLCMHCLETN